MTVKYFIYARKSTDAEDRQVSSIEDQVVEIKKIAQQQQLEVVDIISEAKSAKKPGRKEFDAMIKRIKKGEAEGILCWKLNRLARNPIDGGTISMMLQLNEIKHIQTYQRGYYPTDNVLLMAIEFGMANQFVKDLSVDVKRGMYRKAERGWMPSRRLPVGYIHNPNRRLNPNEPEIIKDQDSFPIVKRLWKLLLTGNYAVSDLKRLGDTLGLVKINGKTISETSYYRIFANQFYAGYFKWRNLEGEMKVYKGKHPTIVSMAEFEKAQVMLSTRHVPPKVKDKENLFQSIMRCGECGCSITKEVIDRAYCFKCKRKFSIKNTDTCPKCDICINQKENFSFMHKIYYRCTKKRGKCSQPYILKEELEQQIQSHLQEINIDDDFYSWALEAIEKAQISDPYSKLRKKVKCQIAKAKSLLEGYVKMRAQDEISATEFSQYKNEATEQVKELSTQLDKIAADRFDFKELAKNDIKFAYGITKKYEKGDFNAKRKILRKFGSNPTLMAKSLCFSSRYWLTSIPIIHSVYKAENDRLEPEDNLIKPIDFNEGEPAFSILCRELKKARINYKHDTTFLS